MSESRESVETLERRIQELERENQALRDRERSLLEVVGNTPAPIYLKDAQLKYLLVNRRYEEVSQLVGPTLVGKTDYDIYPQEIADLFRTQDEEVIRHRGCREFEETVTMPSGSFTFLTVKFPVYDETGALHSVGGFCTDITARKKSEEEREALIEQLQKALKEVAKLRGILPICAWCKKIRDDQGYWSQLEQYIIEHSDVEFTHGICPGCLPKLEASAR
jgi:PAS domain S-box-containing protein